ncbi:gephyrin-like molybdotransferase Glp [Acidipropionibacterium virtanenii]|uniref:Molybdopterin molybdenumtransferase n=1 Tax=Acidipropionibacterium virtanenii TaxID=2057246 RepID=A0A344UW71_9ACTN|nr:gephyrin-like molybdotransferase Glp [Acidipropionibacterium virtanenii]AXE39519.1 Molybdopterin molybdenumtransferase 1 [Acidipropionibacterium virtanenii]
MALFRRKKIEPPTAEEEAPLRLPGAPADDVNGRRGLEVHRDFLVSAVRPLTPFGLSIGDALGLELCEDVPAPTDVPHLTTAAIDGFAFDSATTTRAGNPYPVHLQIDRRPPRPVLQGTAVSVRAGAELPDGTDCVVGPEVLDEDGKVTVTEPVPAWSGCRLAGSDFAGGEVIAPQGSHLNPGRIALLAAAGVDKVFARPRPRVVVLGTGGGEHPDGEDVPQLDATAQIVAAAARNTGSHVWLVDARDSEPDELRETVTDQLIRADLLLSTSDRMVATEPDPVGSLLPELGATDFCQVAMTPGSYQGFGLIGPELVPVMVLPPGPGAALAAFHAFARPVLNKLAGGAPRSWEIAAEAGSLVAEASDLASFVPVRLEERNGRVIASRAGHGDPARLADLAMSDALAVIPTGSRIDVGDDVTCWSLGRS